MNFLSKCEKVTLYSCNVFELQLPTYETELEKMWQSSPQEVKQTYGRTYVDGMIKSIADYSSKSSNSIAAVVDTIEMSVISQNPKQRYLVDGSSSLVDQDNVSQIYII